MLLIILLLTILQTWSFLCGYLSKTAQEPPWEASYDTHWVCTQCPPQNTRSTSNSMNIPKEALVPCGRQQCFLFHKDLAMISLHGSNFCFKLSEGHKQILKSQLFIGVKLVFLCYILLHALNKYNCIHFYDTLNLQNLYAYHIYSLQSIQDISIHTIIYILKMRKLSVREVKRFGHSQIYVILFQFLFYFFLFSKYIMTVFNFFYYTYHFNESNDHFEVISLPLYQVLAWSKGLSAIGSWRGLPDKIQGIVKFEVQINNSFSQYKYISCNMQDILILNFFCCLFEIQN